MFRNVGFEGAPRSRTPGGKGEATTGHDMKSEIHTGVLARLLAAAFVFALAGSALAQSVVDQARVLLRDGKAKQAYDLLEPAADQLNDAESAYLLGIAALDSGKAGLAVMAFERALGYNPNFAPARAELVRALMATGETDQARLELARLANVDVPPEVRQRLTELGQRLAGTVDVARRRTRGIAAYLEAEAGYDSNINTGANSRSFAIPLFGGATATLDRIFQKQGSTLAGVGGGFTAFNEVQPGLRVFAGLDGKARYDFKEIGGKNYHTEYVSGNAGARWQRSTYTLTGALTILENRIGNVKFDQQFGAYGQWQTQLDPNNEVGVYLQWLDMKHPIQRTLDTKFTLAGVSWRHAFAGAGTPIMTLAGYLGDDKERGSDPAVGRRITGVRAGFERQLDFGARFVSSLTYQRSKYGGENLFFFRTREDKRTDLLLGLVFVPAKDITLTPQYLYTRNNSNIPVVDFGRHQLLVTLRRDFY